MRTGNDIVSSLQVQKNRPKNVTRTESKIVNSTSATFMFVFAFTINRLLQAPWTNYSPAAYASVIRYAACPMFAFRSQYTCDNIKPLTIRTSASASLLDVNGDHSFWCVFMRKVGILFFSFIEPQKNSKPPFCAGKSYAFSGLQSGTSLLFYYKSQ